MAESTNRVEFEGITWIASRPEVLPFLTSASACFWGTHVEFHAAKEDLIAVGVASADMFDLNGAGQRTGWDGFGNQFVVKPRRGKWDLQLRMNENGGAAPSDEDPKPCAWWKKHGGEAEAATAKILRRFARPRARR